MEAKNRLDALTGLRFLAAAAVALAHLPRLHLDPSVPLTARRLFMEGGAGVPFFFVLSGFVLAYSYHDRLARPSGRELARYALSRVARLWPVYLLSVALIALWPVGPAPSSVGAVVANLALVQVWPPTTEVPVSLNPVAWSLSVEVFFYLALPLFLWALARRPGIRPWPLVCLAVAVWCVHLGLVLWHRSHLGPWTLYVCNLCPPVRLGEFGVGLLLGLAFVRGGGVGSGPTTARTRAAWTVLELAAVVLVGVTAFQSDKVSILLRLSGYYTPALGLVVAVFARQRGLLSGLMAGRVPVFLGEVSFAFFLLHVFVFTHLWEHIPADRLGSVRHSAVMLTAALLLSAVVYRCYEAPLRAWLVGLGRPRKDRPESRRSLLGWLRPARRAGNVG
jgi:peptidoglycan/LPS O-acetylase OafA/YrhL